MPAGAPNLVGLTQFDNQDLNRWMKRALHVARLRGSDDSFQTTPARTSYFGGDLAGVVLDQGSGYGIVVGFGFFFVFLTIALVYGDYRARGGRHYNSEDFNTAGRTIKTGLIAVDVISHWTWSSTLLQSSNEVFTYGIAGAFWYAAGAVLQILLFGVMAVEIKRKAPRAHTVLELVRKRWGHAANIVFFYICIINNIFICVLLFLGAGSVFNAATGMSIYACCLLIPLSVVIYTVAGGLKATFTSSYLHTVVIFIGMLWFTFKVYASTEFPIGSISAVWNNLNTVAANTPVAGNQGGSYMTIMSNGGLQFGILEIISSFGNVWADQSYWQSAIAATPTAAWKGYLLGGIMWFCIPFTLSTSLGLATVALDLPVSVAEANMGLVPVAAASYVLGKGGVALMLIIIFMAVTSAGSSEFMAVGSLFTFDIYKTYIRPNASSKELLLVTRITVFVFGMFTGVLSIILFVVGISVNLIFLVVGLVVSSAVPPLAFLLTWRKVPRGAAITAALVGQAAGIIAWLVHTQVVYGAITQDTSQNISPTMDGTIVAIGVSFIICIVWTLIAPDKNGSYDAYKTIELEDCEDLPGSTDDPMAMNRALKYTWWAAGVLTLVFIIIWPVLVIPAGVFNLGYFGFWVSLSMVWALVAGVISTFLPLWESRDVFMRAAGSAPANTGNNLPTTATSKQSGQFKTTADDSAHRGQANGIAKV